MRWARSSRRFPKVPKGSRRLPKAPSGSRATRWPRSRPLARVGTRRALPRRRTWHCQELLERGVPGKAAPLAAGSPRWAPMGGFGRRCHRGQGRAGPGCAPGNPPAAPTRDGFASAGAARAEGRLAQLVPGRQSCRAWPWMEHPQGWSPNVAPERLLWKRRRKQNGRLIFQRWRKSGRRENFALKKYIRETGGTATQCFLVASHSDITKSMKK